MESNPGNGGHASNPSYTDDLADLSLHYYEKVMNGAQDGISKDWRIKIEVS